jgi:hypothetical protein
MAALELFLLPTGVSAWENDGKDALSWLTKRLAKRVEDVQEVGWERLDWLLVFCGYRHEVQRLDGSLPLFGT